MNWTEYQARTHETAIYPRELALHYLIPGLAAEVHEAEDQNSLSARVTELQDVLWFASEISGVMGGRDESYGLTVSDVYIRVTGITLEIAFNGIRAYSKELLDLWVKCVRDQSANPDVVTSQRIIRLVSLIVSLIRGYAALSGEMTFEVMLTENIQRLQDRKRRGVLSGSGDTR